eukprot:GHVO01011731.1.p1 GENE.GHVO01011731.1~~GHVO01011731.1.p1  ORF type:complete len:214 (+),score=42.26 GHVO01011731.1:80-721(+)
MFHYGGRRQPPGSRGTPNMGGGKFTQPPRPRLPPPGMDKIQPNLAMGVYGQIAAPPHPQYHRGVNNRMPLSWSTPPPQPQRRSVLDILRLEETNLRNEIRTIDSNILDLETGLQNFAWTLGVDACPSFLDTSTIASMKSILRGGFESTHCRFVPRVPLQRMHGKRVGPTVVRMFVCGHTPRRTPCDSQVFKDILRYRPHLFRGENATGSNRRP